VGDYYTNSRQHCKNNINVITFIIILVVYKSPMLTFLMSEYLPTVLMMFKTV